MIRSKYVRRSNKTKTPNCVFISEETFQTRAERMNISDTFYVALCMTILIIGVVYWFWTQNQYIQRKLNLLENIVYELKTTLNAPGLSNDQGLENEKTNYPPSPALEEDEIMLHQELHETIEEPVTTYADPNAESKNDKIDEISGFAEDVSDSLQPGGVGSSLQMDLQPDSALKGSSLDAMTLKELRRLAEQRKISGASGMRKQALIDALRSNVDIPTIPEDSTGDSIVSE